MIWAKVTFDGGFYARYKIEGGAFTNHLLGVKPLMELPNFQWWLEDGRVKGHYLVEVPDDVPRFLEWTAPLGRFFGNKIDPEVHEVNDKVVEVTIEVHFNTEHD